MRRRTAAALMRRVPSGSGAPTYQSILGPLLVEYWHASLGIATVSGAVDTWTGQLLGTVIQAPAAINRPVYGADGSFFLGKSVVQCAVTNSLRLQATGLSPLLATGTRPYYFYVGRSRVLNTGAYQHFYAFRGGSGAAEFSCRQGTQGNGAGTDIWHGFKRHGGGNVFADSGDVQETLPHFFEFVNDATDGIQACVDLAIVGSNATATAQAASLSDVTEVYVGGANTGEYSNSSALLVGCCSAKPSAAQRAALFAVARADGGF